jgi:tetratricopeptide (TPR) repeat protein
MPSVNLAPNACNIEEAATSNLEAYRHYQLGVDLTRRFLMAEAVRELEEAVRLDPQFALAYWRLSGGYAFLGDLRKGQELWPKIEQLQSHLPRKDLLEFQANEAFRAGDQAGGETDSGITSPGVSPPGPGPGAVVAIAVLRRRDGPLHRRIEGWPSGRSQE